MENPNNEVSQTNPKTEKPRPNTSRVWKERIIATAINIDVANTVIHPIATFSMT
jgi:hypothetical protein